MGFSLSREAMKADRLVQIHRQAEALIAHADALGVRVVIEPRSHQPPAMRSYDLVVTVWEKR